MIDRQAADRPDAASPAAPVGALLGSMISIQLGATLAKGLFHCVGAEGATALRLLFGALMLMVGFRPWRSPAPPSAWPALIAYGVVMGLMNLFFYMALARIPLGIAVAVEFTGPLAVALAGSRRPADFVWVAFAVAGLALLAPRPSAGVPLDPVGLAFALAAGACWAAYILLGQKAGGDHGTRAAAIGTLVGAALILPVGLWREGGALFQPAILPLAILVGALSSAIPYTLEMIALIRLPAKTYGTLVSVEPAMAALIGLTLLGERLALMQWAAIAAIVVASVGSALALRGAGLTLPD